MLRSKRFGDCHPKFCRSSLRQIEMADGMSLSILPLNPQAQGLNPPENDDDGTVLSNISPHPSNRPIFSAIQMDAGTRGKFLLVDLILTGP